MRVTSFLLLVFAEACEASAGLQTVEFTIPKGGIRVGSESAEWVLVEFGDHLCPACRRLSDSVLPVLEGRIKSAILQYRFVEAGASANDVVAATVECMAEEVGFFAARRRLYTFLDSDVTISGVSNESSCMESPERRTRRSDERSLARNLGVPGTPTLVLGRWSLGDSRVVGWVMVGPLTADSLSALVDEVVQAGLAADARCR